MKTKIFIRTPSLCSILFFVNACVFAQGNLFIVAPPEAAGGNEGNSSFAPFSTTASARFQQIYSASIFSAILPPGGGIIRDINLRSDINGFPFQSQIGNFQVNLSTTLRNPDGLSPIFGDNTGVDDQVVFGPAPYRIGGGPGQGFNTDITINTPFYYNPANGNLLLDFRIYTGAGNAPTGGLFDAFNAGGDLVSSVFAFGSSLPTSGSANSLGLATAFVVTPVPEPSSWALLIVGMISFGLWQKRQ